MKRSAVRLRSFGSEEQAISRRLRSPAFSCRFAVLFVMVSALGAALLALFFISRSVAHMNEHPTVDPPSAHPVDSNGETADDLVETPEHTMEKSAFDSFVERRSPVEQLEHPTELLTFVDEERADVFDLDYSLSHPLENKCRFPLLRADTPDPARPVVHRTSAFCKMTDERTLVEQVHTGELLVGRVFKDERKSDFTCFAKEIGVPPNESRVVELPFNERVFVEMDQFRVDCENAKRRTLFSDVFTNVPFKRPLKPDRIEGTKHFSLNILVLDNVSRNSFFRHAPESLKFMREKGFQVKHGLNGRAVDGFDERTERTIRRLMGVMKDRGCATMWNDDRRSTNPIKAKRKREEITAIAHYFYPDYYAVIHNDPNTFAHCHNGHLLSQRFVGIWERFASRYSKRCHFSFNVLSEMTGEEGGNLEVLDQALFTTLMRMDYNEVFENTITILMGSQRASKAGDSYLTHVEQNMPLFAAFFPPKFAGLHPSALQNFVENKNRLTTEADVRKTLLELLNVADDESAGVSLLHEISADRTCADAGIPPADCVCQELVEDDVIPLEVKNELNEQLAAEVEGALRELECVSKVDVQTATYFAAYRLSEHHAASRLAEDGPLAMLEVEFKARARVNVLRLHAGEPVEGAEAVLLKARATYSPASNYTRLNSKPMIEQMDANCDLLVLDDLCSCFFDY